VEGGVHRRGRLFFLSPEALVLTLYATTDIGFLWFNAIGCAAVYVLAAIFSAFEAGRQSAARSAC
jgi:hypothetical protein